MGLKNGKWLTHPEFGVHRVPDNPGVVPSFEARGWVVTDIPPELESDDPEFIELLENLQADVQPQAEVEDKGAAKSATKTKKEAE